MVDYGRNKRDLVHLIRPTEAYFKVGRSGRNFNKLEPGDCCTIDMGAYVHDFVYVGNNMIVERSKEGSGVV